MRLGRLPHIKKMAILWILILTLQITLPTAALALTSGPSQPEVQSFEPVGTSEMVDLFSGDFNYNIPLLDVGGYPINLAYHAGVGMEDEASWVGLGWNLNPGAINRNMRGLPDEYAGEEIKRELNIRPNVSASLMGSFVPEIVGYPINIGLNAGVRYNNYTGISIASSASLGLDINKNSAFGLNAGLGIGFDSGNGLDITPNVGLSFRTKKEIGKEYFQGGINIGAPYNSRQGLQELSFSKSFSRKVHHGTLENTSGKTHDMTSGVSIGSSGSLISFNTPSYTTSADYHRDQFSFSINASTGIEFPAVQGRVGIAGTFSKATTIGDRTLSAYGYLNHHLAESKSDLLDFNREKDGPYFETSGILPLGNATYDSYNISGQGVAGSYRGYHNVIGHIYDAKTFATGSSGDAGIELPTPFTTGFLNSFKGGGSVMMHSSSGHSGDWVVNNNANTTYDYGNRPTSGTAITQSLFEPTYFKQIGELSVNNGSYDQLDEDNPLALQLNGKILSNVLIRPDNSLVTGVQNVQPDRTPRNQPFDYLTGNEAQHVGTFNRVYHYMPGLNLVADGELERNETLIPNHLSALGAPDYHPFEMRVWRPDGMRYIYGLPFYNTHKEDVSFNADKGASTFPADQVIEYNATDASADNKNGQTRFYSKETLPPYIYAHGLTAVLSPDYSDLTGDGPSDDDYGTWTKLNYSCYAGPMNPDSNAYHWRFPYPSKDLPAEGSWTANFSEGFKSQKNDNKGNYQFGSKELWYVHSIETRTHIAIFHTSDRHDAQGVDAPNGITTTAKSMDGPMQKLDSIKYYAKNDLEQLGTNAIALKTVHFNYNYSLCPDIPNNRTNQGKLTLESVYFTYGNSIKGQFSKYVFHYDNGNTHDNPVYNRKAQDRWGNFQEEYSNACHDPENIESENCQLSNSDFSYCRQDKSANDYVADQYAQAWNLKQIDLPSGGIIKVKYESDDYAFIQDKRAGQMFTLFGTSERAPTKVTDPDQDGVINTRGKFNNFITLKLEDPLMAESDVDRRAEFYDYYLKDIEQLYFRCLVDLKDGNYEFVPGYASIADYGVIDGQDDYVWIELKGVGYNDNTGLVNPIAKAAWQFARLNIPHLVFPGQDPDQSDFGNVIRGLSGLLTKDLPRMINGFNKQLAAEGYSSSLIPGKSYIRLHHPNGAKKGGGCRVKKLSITDRWSTMNTSGNDAEYGQQYFYKTSGLLPDGSIGMMSSGVASYEPVIGGDENPFRRPISFDENRALAPDNNYYIEHPIGESLFPTAHVGYSKVIVANIRPNNQIERTATGYSMNEFYTAKDFPYEVKLNLGTPDIDRPKPISKLFNFSSHDFLHASQGYSVVLNDMHGKVKSIQQFEGSLPYIDDGSELELTDDLLEKDAPMSGVRYFYKQTDGKLDNQVDVVSRSGEIDPAFIGVESEMVLDFREQENKSFRTEAQIQIDVINIFFVFGTAFIPLPSVWMNYSDNHILFRSSVATKVINHHGLIDKIQVFNEGSIIETNNLLYDEETGEVLLTSVNNEFRNNDDIVQNTTSEDDLIYNLKYPAHWAYDGMGPAYQNMGAEYDVGLIPNGIPTTPISNADHMFHPGDEILATTDYLENNEPKSTSRKLWVAKVTSNSITLITETGELFSGIVILDVNGVPVPFSLPWTIKVIRSGHRNQQSLPIAQLTSLKNPGDQLFGNQPISTTDPIAQADALHVLDFSAQEFGDQWQTYCDQDEPEVDSCFYSMEILHPDYDSTLVKVEILPDSTRATVYYRCVVTKSCGGTTGVVENSLQTSRSYETNSTTCGFRISANEYTTGLFIESARVYNSNGTMAMNIPLSPASAVLMGVTTISDPNHLILDINNTALFFNSLKAAIQNYLFSQSFTAPYDYDLQGVHEVAAPNGKEIWFNWRPKHLPSGNWIGMDRDSQEFAYYSVPGDQLITVNEVNGHLVSTSTQAAAPIACSYTEACTDLNVISSPIAFSTNNYNFLTILNPATFSTSNFQTIACPPSVNPNCGISDTDTINPFIHGVRGNWRPTASYVHDNVPRKASTASTNTDVANDGYYTSFDQFWIKPNTADGFWTAELEDSDGNGVDDDYIASATVTKYSPYGQALESKDALDIYSSAILGYDQKLAIAAGANTRYHDMAFDGFEEYTFYQRPDLCHSNPHIDLLGDASIDRISDEIRHTGFYSLNVESASIHSVPIHVNCPNGNEPGNGLNAPYVVQECEDCLPTFNPTYIDDHDNKYVFDAWIYHPESKGRVFVQFWKNGTGTSIAPFKPAGPVIDGWQRIYTFFTLPNTGIDSMIVNFHNQGSSEMYVDDVRMYPFDANMKSFVYHPSSLKLMAELDENNHATFYEYDEEWNLIRVKKETERGIVTLQENRSNVRIDRN